MNDPHREGNPTAAFDPAERVAELGGPSVSGGTLSAGYVRALVAGSAVLALAGLLVTVTFTIVLLFVLTAVFALPTVYVWSRIAESPRQATDRLMTLAIVAGFGIAVAPLFSLLYEVVSRGAARFDGAFFTESSRGVI